MFAPAQRGFPVDKVEFLATCRAKPEPWPGRRRVAGRAQGSGGRTSAVRPLALAAHLVGIPAVVADGLGPPCQTGGPSRGGSQ